MQPYQYPPQFPMAPAGYPIQPQYPQPQQVPAYGPPAGYGQPAPAPAGPPLPVGTLDDYFSQPTGGAPSFKFQDANRQPLLQRAYGGYVSRPIVDGDIRPQTNNAGAVSTYRDGRPKFVMVVPMTVAAGPEFPEGQASWWCKGQARDELNRAMAEAGAPSGAPEMGAFIWVQLVSLRPIPGNNPQFVFRVQYFRPGAQVPAELMALPAPVGAPQQAAQAYVANVAQAGAVAQQMQMPGYTVPQVYGAPQPPAVQYAPPAPPQAPVPPQPPVAPAVAVHVPQSAEAVQQVVQQPGMAYPVAAAQIPMAQPPAPPAVQAPVPPAAPVAAAPMAMPAGLDPAQQALFLKLSGQGQAAA